MAELVVSAVLDILSQNLKQILIDKTRRGDEVVRWIEYELETLIPQLERAPHQDETLTNTIRKAELLCGTYMKRVIQIRVTAPYRMPIDYIRIIRITWNLNRIQHDFAEARNKFSEAVKEDRKSSSNSAAEQHPAQGAVQSAPSYLKRFIRYFILFPPEFQVPARRMIALWVAEGLVHSKKHDNLSVEQIAERYLDELREAKEVRVKTNRSGKVKCCWIDSEKRNQLLLEEEHPRPDDTRRPDDGKISWLVDCNGSGGNFFIQIDGNQDAERSYKDVVSFLSFNTQEGSKPGEDIGDFLKRCISAGCFKWLNVLDLERVFRPKLPDTLGKLIALKYLGLRWTYLEQLPDSVERLFNLEVLDVKHTYISILPRSIWRMQFLRHLYLSEAYRTRFPDPPWRGALTSLQTLWGAFVEEDTCVTKGLDRSLNIRKLGLSCRWRASTTAEMSDQLKAIDRWISNLKFLHSLRLKSRDESGKAAPLHLTSLAGNKDLSTVYLLGNLDRLILCELPASLTDLTLSGSELDVDPMPFLGVLPNLVILRLLGQSVVCSKMHCSRRRGFRKLKFLYIWKLENLEEFETEEESLPCLDELEIRSCGELKQLPDRLRKIQNLKIKLTSMKPDFVRRAGSKYAKVEHVPKDDQYILTNTPTFGHETHDLVSSCFISYEHSISRNNAPGSIF